MQYSYLDFYLALHFFSNLLESKLIFGTLEQAERVDTN